MDPQNLSYLPEIFALVSLIGCFRPLVRRAGPHVNLWFVGWFFLLLHFTAQFMLPAAAVGNPSATGNPFVMLAARWALDLCALTFVLASESIASQRIGRPVAAVLALPILFQSALFIFPRHPAAMDRLAVLLFVAPALYLLFSTRRRWRQTILLGTVYLVLGGLTLQTASQPGAVSDAALSILFLAAAYLFLRSTPRTGRGVIAAVAGLAGWGLAFPLVALCSRFDPAFHLSRVALELPMCLMAGGIILTLLEDHVIRTERLATHDPLTDLPNRRMFEERFAAALDEARVQCTTIACLVIDIDNFKTINDVLGHDAGDQVLCALAGRLGWHITPRDLLARTGGDEFTALLAGVHDEHHLKFIAGAMMSAASVPILVDGKPLDVRISIGIALSPDHADDTDGLRRAADLAMYSAKRRGGSLLAFAGED